MYKRLGTPSGVVSRKTRNYARKLGALKSFF